MFIGLLDSYRSVLLCYIKLFLLLLYNLIGENPTLFDTKKLEHFIQPGSMRYNLHRERNGIILHFLSWATPPLP